MNDNNGLCQILVSANAFLEVVEARHAVALAQIAEQEQLLVCAVSEEAVHLFYHDVVVVLSVQVVVYQYLRVLHAEFSELLSGFREQSQC